MFKAGKVRLFTEGWRICDMIRGGLKGAALSLSKGSGFTENKRIVGYTVAKGSYR